MNRPNMVVWGWKKIHNSTISTFLVYLNWWSTFVVGGLSFIPMLASSCNPQTEFPFHSSWIEIYTFVLMLLQSAVLSLLLRKIETPAEVNNAEIITWLYHGQSLIMPVLFLLLNNLSMEWEVNFAKVILQYHMAQNVISAYSNHFSNITYDTWMGVWVATFGKCQHENPKACIRTAKDKALLKYSNCYADYFLWSVQLFVAISIVTPFMMKILEMTVSLGTVKRVRMLRVQPQSGQPEPQSRSRRWFNWPSLPSVWKRVRSSDRSSDTSSYGNL